MPTEYVKSGDDVKDGMAAKVGPRGGVRYDTNRNANISGKQMNGEEGNDHPPTYVIQGPGVDMAFFRKDGGFDIRYAGPYCDEAIELAKVMLDSQKYSFRETIDYLCKEFNCAILDNQENKQK